MNELELVQMALAAKEDLFHISAATEEIKLLLRKEFDGDNSDVKLPSEVELSGVDGQSVEAYTDSVMVYGDNQFSDLLQFQYMQTVTGVVIAVTLMLMLGVQLFQSFNQHWR